MSAPRDIILAVLTTAADRLPDGRPLHRDAFARRLTWDLLDALITAGHLPPQAATPAPAPVRPTVALVVTAVADAFAVDVAAVTSTTRVRRVVRARQAAMYLCRTWLGMSTPEIGLVFHRDHTTVLYGINAVHRLTVADPEFAAALDRCVPPAVVQPLGGVA